MADPVTTARITLSAPAGTQAGTFNVIASFAESVSGFGNMNISLTPDATAPGDGIAGITWAVTGSGRHYNILFEIPNEAHGRFDINVSGQVTLSGEMVDIAGTLTLSVAYDTATELTAVFGDLRYRETGEIELPITFNEPVLYFHKTDAELSQVVGDVPYDFQVALTEVDAQTYEFSILPPPNRRGAFMIDLTGYVFRSSTSIRDNILVTRKLVPFNTYEIYMLNANIPDALTTGVWDIFVELSAPAIDVSTDDFIYAFEGTLPDGFLDSIVLYRARSLDVVPGRPSALVDASAAAIGEWDLVTGASTKQGKYFILRFDVPSSLAGRQLSITPKQGVFRPPVPGV